MEVTINMEKKKVKIPFTLLFVILFIAGNMIFNSVAYVTNENQYSVIKEFGRIAAINDSAGLRIKKPFVQSVNYISKAIRLYDINESEVITSDKKTMIINAFVLWKVTDAKAFTSTLNASDITAQGRLDVIVFNAIKNTISSMTQEEVIASRNGKKEIDTIDTVLEDIELQNYEAEDTKNKEVKNIAISDKLLEAIGTQCAQYGIEIIDIEIKILDLPEENKAAVYERMITERNNIATAYKAQGQSAAQKIRNNTDKEVSVMLSEAQASAEKTVAEGEAEYMKILADAYNNQEKADFYMYSLQLDAVKKSLSGKNDNVLILDKDSPLADIFNGLN